MPTIKNHFSNMYGNGKNLNVSKNKTVNELLNNIPNIKINTNSNTNNLNHSNESGTPSLNVMNTSTPYSRFNIYYIFIILFIVGIIGLIFYFKDKIIDNYNKLYNQYMFKDTPKVDDAPKVDDTPKVDTHKMDEIENKLDTLIKKECPAINKLNTKIEDASYTKEQKSTEAGFCYIGYDNGQRDCIDIYEGDVCMSGQIFSSLDICINPKLRP